MDKTKRILKEYPTPYTKLNKNTRNKPHVSDTKTYSFTAPKRKKELP